MTESRELCVTPASRVTARSTRWAWAGRIPLGAVSLFAGREGLGKSTALVELTARITRGELDGDLHGQPASIIYASAEDSASSTLKPRLMAAGADLDRAFLLDVIVDPGTATETPGALTFPDDLAELERLARETGAAMIVLDPLVSYLHGDVNAHRDQHVRRVLAPLGRIADDLDLAIPGVIHLNKGDTTDVLARVSGSVGFTSAARSVLVFGRNPDDPNGEAGAERVLAHPKCNVGPQQPSLLARIEPRQVEGDEGETIPTSRLTFVGETESTARDLLAQPATTDERTARGEAADFLRTELANGPVATTELRRAAEAAGLAWRTVERAKQRVDARARKTANGWAWELASKANSATSPNSPPGGLVGLGGLEDREGSKTANTANTATPPQANGVADLDADAELERLTGKFGPNLAGGHE